jgi:hypothetical protein
MLLLALKPFNLAAQEETTENGPGDNPDPGIPVDGGVAWLAVAGAAYGLKRYHDYRQRSKSNPDQ